MEAAIRDLKALANRHRFEETLGRSIFAYVNDAVSARPAAVLHTGPACLRSEPVLVRRCLP